MFRRTTLNEQVDHEESHSVTARNYKNIYIDFITELINKLKDTQLYSEKDKIEIEKIKKLEEYQAEWEETIKKIEDIDIAIRYETNSLLVESCCSGINNQKKTKAEPFSAAWGYDFLCNFGPVPGVIQEKVFKITSLFVALGNRIMQIYNLQDKIKGLFADSHWNNDISDYLHHIFKELDNKDVTTYIEKTIIEPIIKSIRKEKRNQPFTQSELTKIIQEEFATYVKENHVKLPDLKKIATEFAIIKMLNNWNSFLKNKKGKIIDKNKPYPGYPDVLYDTELDARKWAKNTFAPCYLKDLQKRKNRAKKTDALDGPHYGGDEGEQKIDKERSVENTDIFFDESE